MKLCRRVSQLREYLDTRTGTIGFVPTMGALHEGHISLVSECRSECDTVVVSIFVNPTQFNDPKDLENYPRMESEDLKLLEGVGVDVVFAPEVSEMYPEPDTRIFDFGQLDKVMEGAHRPGHFNGVGQVVSKLFDMVRPDKAYFGEKDFQQLAIIRRMVEDAGSGIEIIGCPIVREEDGLAKSSRNLLLTKEARLVAPEIYRALCRIRTDLTVGEAKKQVAEQIDRNPELKTEYVEIVDPKTLQPAQDWRDGKNGRMTGGLRCCVAVRAGNIRLIDNIAI